MKSPSFTVIAFVMLGLISITGICYAESAANNAKVQPSSTAVTEADQQQADQKPDETTTLSESLNSLHESIIKLNADLQKAKNEELDVLREQRRRKYTDFHDELKNLINHVVELEQADQEISAAKKVAVKFAKNESGWLKTEINDAGKRITKLDEQVKTASEADAPELKQQIATERKTLDELLTRLHENTELHGMLGIDSRADQDFLDNTLTNRAENLAASLEYLVEQRDGLRKQAFGAGEDEKKRLKEKVSTLDGRIASAAENLKTTIDLMQSRKLDAAEYKQIIITSTGEITKEIFQTEVALGLMQQWLDSGKDWLIEEAPKWIFKLLVFVLILLVFSLLAKIVKRVVSRTLSSSRVRASTLLKNLLVSFAGKSVFLVGILIALAQLGFQVGPVLAGLGIVGFIVGFALQDTLSNFASGVMILIYRPFDVGDAVETGGIIGKVRQMNLVSTTITTPDNQRVIVPNRKIWGDVIRNINAEKVRRVDMVFGIGYDDDPDLAERILHEIVDHHELALDDPAPVIRLHTLGESSVDFIVRPWVKSENYWEAYWHITRQVKKRFDEEGISIPFPQQDMHIYTHDSQTQEPSTNGLIK